MKKQFKIRVPERDTMDVQMLRKSYTRQEIHELIQKKAVELGYPKYEIIKDAPYIILTTDKVFSVYDKIENCFQDPKPIEWQDFLKLTPKDVEVQDDILDQEDVDQICRVAMGSENNNIESITTERNEKAWDLLKIIVAGYGDGASTGPRSFDEIVSYGVRTSFKYADEFLKQAGEEKNESN